MIDTARSCLTGAGRLLATGVLALGLAAALFGGAAEAQTRAGPDTTATAAFGRAIDDVLKNWISYSELPIVVSGATRVTGANGGMLAVLPRLALETPFGIVSWQNLRMHVAELDADRLQVAFEVPEPPLLGPVAGKGEPLLRIGRQSLHGVWRPSIQNFEEVDMRLQDVTFAKLAPDFQLALGGISLAGKLTANGDDRWSGKFRYALEGVRVIDAGNGVALGIGSLSYEAGGTDMRLAAYVRELERFGVHWNRPASVEALVQDPQRMVEFLIAVPKHFGAIEGRYAVRDVTLIVPEGGQQPAFQAAAMAFALGLGAESAEKTRLSMALDLDGIAVGKGLSLPVDVPEGVLRFAIDLDLGGLPGPAVWRVLTRNVSAALASASRERRSKTKRPAGVEVALRDAFEKTAAAAVGIIAGSQPVLAVNRLSLGFGGAALEGAGRHDVDFASNHFGTGSLDAVFTGLEPLLARFGQNPGDDTQAALVLVLAGLKGLATPEARPDGSFAHKLRLTLTEDGKVMGNGLDLTALLKLLRSAGDN